MAKSVSFCLPHVVAVSAFIMLNEFCTCVAIFCMCVLYVSFGSTVRAKNLGCVVVGSVLLFICKSRLQPHSAGSSVNRVQAILSGFMFRLFC